MELKKRKCKCQQLQKFFSNEGYIKKPEHDESGFILNNGSFVILPTKDEYGEYSITHDMLLRDAQPEKDIGTYCDLDNYIEECKTMRIRVRPIKEYMTNKIIGHRFILTTCSKPNEKQLKTLNEFFRPEYHNQVAFYRECKASNIDCDYEPPAVFLSEKADVQIWLSRCWR